MAADTNSPLLNLLLMGTGNDNNSWGVNNNANLTAIENAIAANSPITGLTGGSRTLTALEMQASVIALAGALVSDQTIVVPNLARSFLINNGCAGAFFVILKTASGNPINIPAGTTKLVFCPGNGFIIRADREAVGELFYYGGASAPAGSLECNGATPLRASAVDLFAAIGTTWGTGNGSTTFTIPDGTTAGKFLRSRTGSVTVGTSQTSQNAAHTHTMTGAPGVGTLTTDSQGNHTHTANVTDPGHTHTSNASHIQAGASASGGSGTTDVVATINTATTGITVANVAAGAHTHNVTGAPSVGTLATVSQGGTEARPESLVGILCIRY